MTKLYPVLSPILADRAYEPGETIELTPVEAALLGPAFVGEPLDDAPGEKASAKGKGAGKT